MIPLDKEDRRCVSVALTHSSSVYLFFCVSCLVACQRLQTFPGQFQSFYRPWSVSSSAHICTRSAHIQRTFGCTKERGKKKNFLQYRIPMKPVLKYLSLLLFKGTVRRKLKFHPFPLTTVSKPCNHAGVSQRVPPNENTTETYKTTDCVSTLVVTQTVSLKS